MRFGVHVHTLGQYYYHASESRKEKPGDTGNSMFRDRVHTTQATKTDCELDIVGGKEI